MVKLTCKDLLDFFIYLRDIKNLTPSTILRYIKSLEWPMRVGFGIYLKQKEFSLLIYGLFHNNPTSKKIVPAWALNHSLETIVSSFKNPTNSREILLKTWILTTLACGNRVSEVSAITLVGLNLNKNHVILPTKSNYQHKTQKRTLQQ